MSSENPEIQLACFSLGENLFGVDIMRIREIILPQRLSTLPGVSQLLEGVINLRGAVIPVMNMRKRFAMPEADVGTPGKLLIVSLPRLTLALAVDNVNEVITVPAREIKPQQDTANDIGMGYLLGVCLSDDRIIMILDIDSLLGQSECLDAVYASRIDAAGTTDHKRVAIQRNTQVNSMQEIQNTLQSADEEARRRTIQDLRGRPLQEICGVLFSAMGDASWRVRKEAVEVFVSSGPGESMIETMLELLRSGDNAGLRNSAAEAVTRLGERSTAPLIRLVQDTDSDVRKFVIDTMICTLIAECGYRNGGAVIRDALSDQSPIVRNAAVSATGRLGLTDAIPEIVRLLDDPDHDIRSSVVTCLQALALVDCRGIQDAARRLGASGRSEQRRNAAILFAALGDGDQLSLLVKDEDDLVRLAAVASIGKLHLTLASAILLMALADENPDVRFAAAEALGEVGDREVVTALTHALNDEDAWVQCAALTSLARIRPEGALDVVQTVLPGAEGLLLITCLKLLEGEGGDQSLELVEQTLDNSDGEVVSLALTIIGRRAVDRIVPHAGRIQAHGSWSVRLACARTVAQLPASQAGQLLGQALENETNDLVRTELQSLLKGLA